MKFILGPSQKAASQFAGCTKVERLRKQVENKKATIKQKPVN